ncbi:CHAD domain-containing protein [Flavobacterium sandaracinum]|nr:CHAD domain-containing protein [Flavobacterium sandaracinum]
MKELVTYCKTRKSALNLVLEKAPESYTVETFHELRVEIKKMKALLQLAAFCNKKFKPRKTFLPFRSIFKQAGKVRELQLQQTLIEEQPNFTLLKKYPNQLKKLQSKAIKKFFLLAKIRLIKKLKKKYRILIYFLAKTDKTKLNHYRNKTRKQVKKLLGKPAFKKNEMHNFRKQLKVYQYNEKILPIDQSSKLIATLMALSDFLGEWHDYEVAILHLKKTIEFYNRNSTERKHLKTIKAMVTLKRELLFHKINATLPCKTFL